MCPCSRCGSKNLLPEKKAKRRSAWWRHTLRVARAAPRVIIYIPLLVFFAFLCDKVTSKRFSLALL